MLKEGIAVNSTASIDYTDASNPKVLGNPTEGALLLWLKDNQVSYQELREAVQVIDELPFTTERKYMAVLVNSALMEDKQILYVKGAPEIVYGLCKQTCHTLIGHKAIVENNHTRHRHDQSQRQSYRQN